MSEQSRTEQELDRITRKLSAFRSFQELLDAEGGYRPSIYFEGPRSPWSCPTLSV